MIRTKSIYMFNLLLIVFLMTLTQFSFANETDQESEIDSQAKEEARIMHSSKGAQIRILQLEASILKNLVKGKSILSYLEDKGKDVTGLELIIIELEEVKRLLPNKYHKVKVEVSIHTQGYKAVKGT